MFNEHGVCPLLSRDSNALYLVIYLVTEPLSSTVFEILGPKTRADTRTETHSK